MNPRWLGIKIKLYYNETQNNIKYQWRKCDR